MAADGAGDDRLAGGHGFQKRHRKTFAQARDYNQVARGKQIADVVAESEKHNPVGDAQSLGLVLQARPDGSVAGDRDFDRARAGPDHRRGFDEIFESFVARQPRSAEDQQIARLRASSRRVSDAISAIPLGIASMREGWHIPNSRAQRW